MTEIASAMIRSTPLELIYKMNKLLIQAFIEHNRNLLTIQGVNTESKKFTGSSKKDAPHLSSGLRRDICQREELKIIRMEQK